MKCPCDRFAEIEFNIVEMRRHLETQTHARNYSMLTSLVTMFKYRRHKFRISGSARYKSQN